MKDAFDDLERELRSAVRARRRPRLLRTPIIALAAALALGGGGALAATQIKAAPAPSVRAPRWPTARSSDTLHAPACRYADKAHKRSSATVPVLPAIARLLPALTPASREL